MSNFPYELAGKWWIDVDPDDKSYVVADVTRDLQDRATTVASVEALPIGVEILGGPEVQGNSIIAKVAMGEGSEHSITFRITCANTEQFDRKINFQLYDYSDSGQEPITIEQAKRHLRVIHDDEDAAIELMIAAARQALEQRLQRALVVREVEETAYGFSNVMQLSVVPYYDNLTVEYVDPDGLSAVVSSNDFEVQSNVEPARVHLKYGAYWPATRFHRNAVILRYRAGYAAGKVPAPLCQWMLLAIGTMYAQRESLVVGVSVVPVPEDFMSMLWQPYRVYA